MREAREAFIEKHADFRPGANVFTWARQILRFEALKIIRARGRESVVVDEELFALIDARFGEHLDNEAVSRLEQQKSALQQCMARLDSDSLDLLLGFYRERLRCEELASARRRSVNAIRLVLSRTRARLRECVRSRLAIMEVRS